MTRFALLTGSSCLAVATALATYAQAAEPVPDGGRITVSVTATVTTKGQAGFRTSAVEHSFTGSCILTATSRMRGDLVTGAVAGDVEAMQQTTEKMAAQMSDAELEAFAQEMEAKMAACGTDEACAMAVMQESMNDPRLQAGAKAAQSNAPEVDALTERMSETNLQSFTAERCQGTITVNDRHVTDDPGGEGGVDAYNETVTIKGTDEFDWGLDRWMMTILGDFKSEQSIYNIGPPAFGQFESDSSVKGKSQATVSFLPDGVTWPVGSGPEPGFLKGGSKVGDAPGGEVTLKWTVKRGG